ncbi:uncharacterized protein PV09_03500 [Verruconis gallopava]|uniref:DUF1750-domain-containing protein n=1 Tax=Verruconis gallopava TaxID=253628 RepID=A0A0D2B2V3_9PEZI|nr:uncharacterized protein PV09_03500 [Verruconis gallopava]KIW05629.1 hypothetical protein PV09_03500 [Verruconis gallopava]
MQAMQHPQDPSFMVHNHLLPHLHLMSTYQFPLMQRVGLPQVLQNLLQAPQIVREMKPMAWTYLQPPQDGTMFLTWQPPRMGNTFATDGYIWLDQEMTYRQNISGYVLEILVHRAGYVLNHEHVASHQRMRYHIIDKDPSLPAIDPTLWLVHYSAADPEYRRPANQFPIAPQIQKLMQERLFLEQQGAVLQRKEFMLVDRSNWPTVSTNTGVQPRQMHPAYQQNPMMARQPPQQVYPQPQLHQPPNKRAKIDRAVAQAIQKNEIPDIIFEEDTEFGDYFDTLTPAEISKMRYKQHHEWMEEIFSSVYSLSQIVPEDLGLGLTGSLKELTDGILAPPDASGVLGSLDPSKGGTDRTMATQQNGYKKLSAEKMEEFEKRIAQFVEKGKADIQAMKQRHAETVAQFNKSKTYMRAERKLRDLSGTSDADAIVKDVETNLGAKILESKRKVCIEEGGLEKEDKTRVAPTTNGTEPSSNKEETASSNGGFGGNGSSNGNGMFETGDNSAAGLLEEFGGGSYTNSPAARISTPGISQPPSGIQTPGATASAPTSEFMRQAGGEAANRTAQNQDDTGLDLLEGMDMDVDMTGLGGAEGDSSKPAGGEDDWVLVNDSANQQQETSAAQPKSASPPTQAEPRQAPASTAANPEPVSTLAEAQTSTNTPNEAGGMFDSADFGGALEGLDTAGDALADFETGTGGEDDLGLDLDGGEFDGAFGGHQ